jgi:CubicO group peptidase (beta-lactamase class C family)
VLSGTIAVGDAYRDVTLTQLLSHTSGMPDRLKPVDWNSFFGATASVAAERRRMAELALARPPVSSPGTAFLYSNFNYVVAGLMLEVVTGQSWETLMSTRLFVPLGMLDAGFGPPAMPGLVDAPWGHSPSPVDPADEYADNPLAMGPAGTVHASLDDILAYVQLYFDGGAGPNGQIVSNDVLAEMTTPRLQNYGFGWVIQQDGEARKVLVHDGSNTMFLALFVVIPARRAAVVVMTNAGDDSAMERVGQLATYLIDHFGF